MPILSGLLLFLTGLVGGLASSCPIGPINLWVIQSGIARRYRDLPPFLSGVVVADLAYAAAAVFGVATLIEQKGPWSWLSLAGSLLLVLIGIHQARQALRPNTLETEVISRTGAVRSFLAGTLLCVTNPAFLMFWIFALTAVRDLVPGHITLPLALIFLAGVAAGDALWFLLLVWITARAGRRASPTRLRSLRVALCLTLSLMGVASIIRQTILASD